MSKKTEALFEIIASDLTYLPSPEERRVKSAFHQRFQSLDIPPCLMQDITLSIAQSLAPDRRLDRWWEVPGFKEWFRNAEEFRERVEYLTSLALDAVTEILISDDPRQASARIAAAKLMLEVGKKMPEKKAVAVYADEKIGAMDKKQLDAYITRQMSLKQLPESDDDK